MKTEERINEIIDDGLERYFEENRRMQNGAISDIEAVRMEIVSVLMEYAGDNGKIDKDKVRQVLRELEVSETIYERLLDETIDDKVDRTIERAINLAIAAFGALLVADMIPSDFPGYIRNLVLTRNTGNGVTMADRLFRLAGDMHDSFRTEVRNGIIQGLTIAQISKRLSALLERNEYHIRRIIMTEGYNVYRVTLGELAKISGAVRAVQIIDNRGRHANHERHECYILAEQDRYGWGKGVYRLEDTFIYYPHPQCTAYFRFLLYPEGGGRGNANESRRRVDQE